MLGWCPASPIYLSHSCGDPRGRGIWYARTRNAAATDETEVAKLPEIATPVQTRIGDVLDTDELCVEIGAGLIVSALDTSRGLGQRITNLRMHVARAYGNSSRRADYGRSGVW